MPATAFFWPTPGPEDDAGDGCAGWLRSLSRACPAARRARGARDRVARCSVSSLAWGSPFAPLLATPSLSLCSASRVLCCRGSRHQRSAPWPLAVARHRPRHGSRSGCLRPVPPHRGLCGARFLCFRAYFGNFLPKYDVHLQYISQFCSAFKRTKACSQADFSRGNALLREFLLSLRGQTLFIVGL